MLDRLKWLDDHKFLVLVNPYPFWLYFYSFTHRHIVIVSTRLNTPERVMSVEAYFRSILISKKSSWVHVRYWLASVKVTTIRLIWGLQGLGLSTPELRDKCITNRPSAFIR